MSASDLVEGKTKNLDPNSSTYWLIQIQADDLIAPHVPRSAHVPYNHGALVGALEGEGDYPDWSGLVKCVSDTAAKIGWPVFLRSDLASAKHSGPESYRAASPEDVSRILCRIGEDGEMKFWLDACPFAFVIREFLELEARFTAFHGLPISREWRFFASPEKIICAHPYWPEEAIKFYGEKEPDGWRAALASLHERPAPDEWTSLESMAMRAASLCPAAPAWSVDFAKDTNGKWWLIDMATMDRSWHWPGCPNG